MKLALTILDAVLALGVIITVVLQSGKSGGLGSLAGGGQGIFSQKKSRDELLAKWTSYLAGSWMFVTLLLSVVSRRLD